LILGRGKVFPFSMVSRLALGPTQPPLQWVLGAYSLGVKWPGCEADHSHLVLKSRMMKLYIHSPILLLGIVLNQLSTGTTALFFFERVFHFESLEDMHSSVMIVLKEPLKIISSNVRMLVTGTGKDICNQESSTLKVTTLAT
jgi:hypothetical protein